MFTKVLIANRGEIACRIIRTLDRLGVASVAVHSEADAHTRHVAMAGEAVLLGPAPAAQSYLNADRILQAALDTGAQAIHPGYGFLSENADFADACASHGLAFIGPTAQNIRDFGLKHTARALAIASGVPVSPGSDLLASVEEAAEVAARIGYPVMIKSTAGGGGIGMQLVRTADELAEKFASVQRLAASNFKAAGLFLEKFIASARHVEVQLFGDGEGTIAVIGERDCSAQRRNQKVIEETPAPDLPESVRESLHASARRLGEVAKYRSAGTCEFMYDADTREFYFLEVNTRLQVEHCVTEEVSGLDLVEWMVRLAAGEPLPLADYRHAPNGHAIEARIYAEDPNKDFQPGTGLLTAVHFPDGVRIDGWVEQGSEVTPYYDPMLAKVIAHAPTRAGAIEKLATALAATRLDGIETNLAYVSAVLADDTFRQRGITTNHLATFAFQPQSVDVLDAGTQTSVQDFPGRLGYWAVGVPPSGPMDSFAFRLANRILENPAGAAGLELTISGPALRFNAPARICLAGAHLPATLDDEPVPYWTPIDIARGQTLRIGSVSGPGIRAFLAFAGGLDVPDYLGSKATFALGGFGGHGGRILRAGDVLRLTPVADRKAHAPVEPAALGYQLHSEWELGVLYGPHGAPDFFTPGDIDMLFAIAWEVHYNSNRTGVRLIGPKPKWARKDGGEAGLHPSNLHDNAYAIGAVDFTGDMPILLGPDGPSLGGFVCPAVVIESERWKLGQLKAGDKVRLRRLMVAEAAARSAAQEHAIANLTPAPTISPIQNPKSKIQNSLDEAILHRLDETPERPAVTYRGAGDRYLLVEYGPLVLDVNLRFRAHALMQWLEARRLPGIIDLTPGIRSLQIHFDGRNLTERSLLDALLTAEEELPPADAMEAPSRIVHLPLSWEDEATLETIRKYMQGVRADAPWCPSNLEFIRRINGLDSIDDVRRIVFDASYLVMGLGDVYLGAPVATPIDPRHRLVTTKYNPARTWTPPNVVGIGGAYLCIYGMEGPGGYQLVGRTIQVWNSFRTTPNLEPGKPWLLRFFDQIRFYPVSADELKRHRADFPQGKYVVRTEDSTFRLRDYHQFLRDIAPEAAEFKARRQAAFDAERDRWSATEFEAAEPAVAAADTSGITLPPGGSFVDAAVAGNLWKILVAPGDRIAAGQPVAIVESMKMEIQVCAGRAGLVHSLLCREGSPVGPGQHLAILTE
ncbi:MAG: urea carboxylase [Terrimicrobiaceae bacterium]|nr:urea carboxylase [Terrimicrobiaceae bacterium]